MYSAVLTIEGCMDIVADGDSVLVQTIVWVGSSWLRGEYRVAMGLNEEQAPNVNRLLGLYFSAILSMMT